MRWRLVQQIARRRRVNREGVETARRHLEASRRERPAVERLAGDLRREVHRNRLAERVDASLRGRRA